MSVLNGLTVQACPFFLSALFYAQGGDSGCAKPTIALVVSVWFEKQRKREATRARKHELAHDRQKNPRRPRVSYSIPISSRTRISLKTFRPRIDKTEKAWPTDVVSNRAAHPLYTPSTNEFFGSDPRDRRSISWLLAWLRQIHRTGTMNEYYHRVMCFCTVTKNAIRTTLDSRTLRF